MSQFKFLLPALLAFAAIPAVSEAQESVPFVTTTYRVQVQYEFWRNGATYWATEFESENETDAELMLLALETALENGYICQILDCDFSWIPRDVRLVVDHAYPWLDVVGNSLLTQKASEIPLYRQSANLKQ